MLCLLLQIFIPYERYVRVLKWLTLSLFAYVGTLFFVHVPWTRVLVDTFWPKIEHTNDYLGLVVSIFGTTISPYMFFWQAGQEVEEMGRLPRLSALKRRPAEAVHHLARIKLDTLLGMGFSQAIAFFIMLTAAVTLHVHGITDIQTSAQAAAALRPIAGDYAFALFAAGIIGTGLLAVPVLAGSAAYAVAEFFRWRSGLGLKPAAAKGFYSIIAISTLLGVLLNFSSIDPMKALLWSAMMNGVVAVPLMAVMMHMSGREKMMGSFVSSPRLRRMGWLATGVMALATLAFGITSWYH
jgi:Mn2+/Fe2+ NRAMP family transporter